MALLPLFKLFSLSFATHYRSRHHNRRALLTGTAVCAHDGDGDAESSRWQRRTAKRHRRTEQLLDLIEASDIDDQNGGDTLPSRLSTTVTNKIPTLRIPERYKINWDRVDAELDPTRGGRIRRGTTKGVERGERKRAQVEAFHYVVSRHLESLMLLPSEIGGSAINGACDGRGATIIDAGCGAGNLAIGLAGILHHNHTLHNVNVLAVDVNQQALDRLDERAKKTLLPPGSLSTLCTDLANAQEIALQVPSNHDVIVVSLHACGSASDMAMELALKCNAPFVICPCCTAKSLTRRSDAPSPQPGIKNNEYASSASFLRSGATTDITYPRSSWLRRRLANPSKQSKSNSDKVEGKIDYEVLDILPTVEEQYTILAKVADVGLGPQTPAQQREHQRRAKTIVEMDRLQYCASETHGCNIRLLRMERHDPLVYGKGEVLLGAKKGSPGADVILHLPVD